MIGLQDVRALNQTRLILEYNAGFTGAMAAMVEAPGSWEICLQVCLLLTFKHDACDVNPDSLQPWLAHMQWCTHMYNALHGFVTSTLDRW